jgi:fatty aldehyde-generating acyl-ACP reductase
MGRESAGVDLALIGHTESWQQVRQMMDALRRPDLPPVDDDALRSIFPCIPPRTVERFTVSSYPEGRQVRGVYIETFIPPDSLGPRQVNRNFTRVIEAIRCAQREGAQLAALGGFASIILQRAGDAAQIPEDIALTTGNTLASAFVVKGVEQAAKLRNMVLERATVLIMGSTGDLGTACASYFAPRVNQLLLCARNVRRLERQVEALRPVCTTIPIIGELDALLPQADVVIAVASLATPGVALGAGKPGALVCDAGYPKNLLAYPEPASANVFWGGMGRVLGGWRYEGRAADKFYNFPCSNIAHGCLLEGVVLALEARYESFSPGHGNITPERMEEIFNIAAKHGIVPAPFFNADGLWPEPFNEV